MKEYEYTGKAMGTDYSVAIICNSQDLADKLASKAVSKIQNYKNKFSRFLSESELCKLNKEKSLVVSREFMEVTLESYKLYKLTKSYFNPLFQIERLGYDRDFDLLNNTVSKKDDSNYDIDYSSVVINEATSKITLRDNQKLDFGGFLKGYLAEKLCKEIIGNSQDILGAIVNIGGDLHTQGVDVNGNNFVFNIYNPTTDHEDISVPIHNQSLATSGTYKRKWQNGEAFVHHILDASGSQNPRTNVISVSVIHDKGGASEAYTKVFLNIEPDEALKILGENKIKYILIKMDGTIIKKI